MSAKYFYDQCHRHKGKAVKITTRDGSVHRGIIKHVDNRQVFIQPVRHGRGLGGFGYGGFYGPSYGYRPGFAYGIALGAIGTLALLPFFFW